MGSIGRDIEHVRARVEAWDWFPVPAGQSSYQYGAAMLRLKLGQAFRRMEWQVESGFPAFVHLPARAVAPWPLGPLGYGGDFF